MKALIQKTLQHAALRLPLFDSKPVIVTGSHRSGTTFVGTILSEVENLKYVYEPFNPDYAYLVENNKCTVCGAKIKTWFPYISDHNHDEYYKHAKHLVNNKAMLRNRALFKSPFGLFATEWLVKNFNFDVVMMIREPLGFVSSIKKMGWDFDFSNFLDQPELMNGYLKDYAEQIEKFAKEEQSIIDQAILMWNAFYSVIYQFQQKYPNWTYVKMEELSLDPIGQFDRIAKELDLTLSEYNKEKIKEMTSSENPTESTKSKIHSINRNAKENVDVWKNRLEEDEVNRIMEGTDEVCRLLY